MAKRPSCMYYKNPYSISICRSFVSGRLFFNPIKSLSFVPKMEHLKSIFRVERLVRPSGHKNKAGYPIDHIRRIKIRKYNVLKRLFENLILFFFFCLFFHCIYHTLYRCKSRKQVLNPTSYSIISSYTFKFITTTISTMNYISRERVGIHILGNRSKSFKTNGFVRKNRIQSLFKGLNISCESDFPLPLSGHWNSPESWTHFESSSVFSPFTFYASISN